MTYRVRDIVGSALLLVLLSPVLLAVAVAVVVVDGFPVLFRQERPGLGERPFRLVKFRTMRPVAAGQQALATDGLRVTRLGRFLRATSLDELPTLWNVLRGQMSLVGPRPLLPEYLTRYDAEQRRRHAVRPGVTGWAQVRGRNAVSWDARLRMDVWYVDHRSHLLDARILLATVWQVLRRRGISAEGHATMPEFRGSVSSGASSQHKEIRP